MPETPIQTETETETETEDLSKVPEWVDKYVESTAIYLGLHIWEIKCFCDNCPDPENPDADAQADIRSRYYIATLRFKPQLIQKPTKHARALILHELLHVVNGPRDLQVNDLLCLLVKTKQQKAAHSLYTNIDEQTVTRLSYALVDLIPFEQTNTSEPSAPTLPENTSETENASLSPEEGGSQGEKKEASAHGLTWLQKESIDRLTKRCPHLVVTEIAEILILPSNSVCDYLEFKNLQDAKNG